MAKLTFNRDEFMKNAMEALKQKVMERLQSIRCPVHGQTATVHFQGEEGTQLKYSISACCEQHKAEVERQQSSDTQA